MKKKETYNYYYNYTYFLIIHCHSYLKEIKVPTINFKCCTSFSINCLNYGQVFIAGAKAENAFFWGGGGV